MISNDNIYETEENEGNYPTCSLRLSPVAELTVDDPALACPAAATPIADNPTPAWAPLRYRRPMIGVWLTSKVNSMVRPKLGREDQVKLAKCNFEVL